MVRKRQPNRGQLGFDLETITHRSMNLLQIRRAELQPGDQLIVKTLNSTYSIEYAADGLYAVTGGWFESQGQVPYVLAIVGCTWGGSVIKIDILAACGLCLEFSNRVVTSPIRQIWLVPAEYRN